jgi:hypothetical protein
MALIGNNTSVSVNGNNDMVELLWPVLQRAETSNTQEIEDVVDHLLDPDQLIS